MRIKELKNQFIETIKTALKEHGMTTLNWSDIDEGCSPIVQEDSYDENNTYTLDSIEEDGIWASNCCDSHFWKFDEVDAEVLESICDELEDVDWTELVEEED